LVDNEVEIEIQRNRALRDLEELKQDIDEAGKSVANQLAIIAEAAMKREAPEGAGIPDNPLKSTIGVFPPGKGAKIKIVKPTKRTRAGWLLHHGIIGNPSTPTYTDERPPIPPLVEWAAAKRSGDPLTEAFKVANSILARGTQETYPNPFVYRSFKNWENSIESVARKAVNEEVG